MIQELFLRHRNKCQPLAYLNRNSESDSLISFLNASILHLFLGPVTEHMNLRYWYGTNDVAYLES